MSRMKHIIASIMMAVLMFSMSGNCSYAKEADTSSHVLLNQVDISSFGNSPFLDEMPSFVL